MAALWPTHGRVIDEVSVNPGVWVARRTVAAGCDMQTSKLQRRGWLACCLSEGARRCRRYMTKEITVEQPRAPIALSSERHLELS